MLEVKKQILDSFGPTIFLLTLLFGGITGTTSSFSDQKNRISSEVVSSSRLFSNILGFGLLQQAGFDPNTFEDVFFNLHVAIDIALKNIISSVILAFFWISVVVFYHLNNNNDNDEMEKGKETDEKTVMMDKMNDRMKTILQEIESADHQNNNGFNGKLNFGH